MQSIDEIVESFSLLDDWEDRYAILIDLGKKLPSFPEDARTEANLVKGCVSKVWILPKITDGVFTFHGDSDAHIVKGLVGLLYLIYNNKPVAEVPAIDVQNIFGQLGLLQNLSPNRRNGIVSMIDRITSYCNNAFSS